MYVEVGEKKTFAGAIDWPGWCRSGKDADAAMQALFDYGPRYAKVLHAAKMTFRAPTDRAALKLTERLKGNATTDFGAPDMVPAQDDEPIKGADLARLKKILKASWAALDDAVKAAAHTELRKGPRGGGRDVHKMIGHVLDSQTSYLRQLAWKSKTPTSKDLHENIQLVEQNTLDALEAAAHGDLPTEGPRGGKLWLPRYFVRRTTWHLLDHVWEIEDRVS